MVNVYRQCYVIMCLVLLALPDIIIWLAVTTELTADQAGQMMMIIKLIKIAVCSSGFTIY